MVPEHLRKSITQSVHGGLFSGHFSGNRLFKVLSRKWWWEGGCSQCCIVSGGGKPGNSPLQPIPISRPFQILGIDVMDLPQTERGNKHVFVIQDFLTKWPWVFPAPDQKTSWIVEISIWEIIPVWSSIMSTLRLGH